MWWWLVARAADPAPAVFTPSSAPGDASIEARTGLRARVVFERGELAVGAELGARAGRWSVGGEFGTLGPESVRTVGSGWLGVALIDRPRLRVGPWVRAGDVIQGGVSAVARTARGGIGGHGLTFDLTWGPAWSTERLLRPSWGGPLDVPASLPEGGVSMPLHPNGSQHLRVGLLGPMPVVSYRLEADWFTLESTLGGLPVVGGVFTLQAGARLARPARTEPSDR
jgi:hypothetical protein